MKRPLLAVILTVAALAPAAALAADKQDTAKEYKLVIENHRFQPGQITIPANQIVRFLVENRDATPEEFDSRDLDREKVLMGNSKGKVFIGPLKPGRYKFRGEFHDATAQGIVIAK